MVKRRKRKLKRSVLVTLCLVTGLLIGFILGNCTAKGKTVEVYTEPQIIEESISEEPFNTVGADWGGEIYEDGFTYYQIPQEFVNAGGNFPEEIQAYLWSLCKERCIDYYIAVALIERESSYRHETTGDSGRSKGYMQIMEKWHIERMKTEGVEDLYDPYGNIRVGLNFLQELLNKAGDKGYNYALMCYNLGESKCKTLYNSGTHSTEYSRGIMQRAQDIENSLK